MWEFFISDENKQLGSELNSHHYTGDLTSNINLY
uniref:Uncharacterized protein n=1 Tax=Anguilla anguilla TaxID=7936 RepID=A0A0E9SG15_ANGAN